jgi:hypothetical protein
MKINNIIAGLLILGTVEYVEPDKILVAYKHHGKTKYSVVVRALSACDPAVGQQVYFYKDYKVVECLE